MSLARLWDPGTYNVIIRGAVTAFQSEHNMTINGDVNSALVTAPRPSGRNCHSATGQCRRPP